MGAQININIFCRIWQNERRQKALKPLKHTEYSQIYWTLTVGWRYATDIFCSRFFFTILLDFFGYTVTLTYNKHFCRENIIKLYETHTQSTTITYTIHCSTIFFILLQFEFETDFFRIHLVYLIFVKKMFYGHIHSADNRTVWISYNHE